MHAYIASTQLARIPLEERSRRCICQACARSAATAPCSLSALIIESQ